MFIYFVFFNISNAPGQRPYWNFMPPSEFTTSTGQINHVPPQQFGFEQIHQQGIYDNIMKICDLFFECPKLKLDPSY